MMIKNIAIIAVVIVILMAGFVVASQQSTTLKPTPTPIFTPTTQPQETISYKGKEGIDALTRLKEQATVEQEASGLVVSINGRKAESEKREYWAFYVNGELAPVGPAQYVTKNGDKIEWKIESY